jgi:hypothetical protein
MSKDAKACAKSGNVCDSCPTAYECGKLRSALVVLESEAAGPEELAEHARLTGLLEASGFAFPDSETACNLSGSRWFVREIVDEVISLLSQRRHQRYKRCS